MNQKRGHWYLLTGLILGASLGVLFAWVISPVEYVDTTPASLRAKFKDQYRVLIASAYTANGDLVRARARLDLLKDDDIYRLLAEQAQRTLAENGSASDARALGLLALALGQGTSGAETPQAFTPTTSSPPTNSSVPESTGVTALTLTPNNTTSGPFNLLSREIVCSQSLDKPIFQIETQDAIGEPISGVLVIITWQDGEERFFTGLKPEKGLGYADFIALPGIAYAIRIGEAGEPVANLTATECQSPEDQSYWGVLLLKFTQP
jgi:hypothetical protein